MNFGLARTAQIAGWQSYAVPNARRTGTASTNASLTWTANNSATTSTTQFEFGTASERLTSGSSDINSANTTIGGMGTTDFTIECWIYLDTLANYPSSSNSNDVYSHDTGYGFGFRLAQSYNSNALGSGANAKYLNIFARLQADLDYWTLPSTWPTGSWQFLVIQRKSGSFAAWLNGTLLSKSNPSSSYNFDTGSASLRIGTADGSNGLNNISSGSSYSYIDEFCISNTYRYDDPAASIPVPTAAFTVDSYTVQLLHMDGTNGGTTFTNATS
jgi:hypothetical protein